MDRNLVSKIADHYTSIYDNDPLLVFAPGRINLIGEHTDYNNGLVLPAAINLGICLAIGKSENQSTLVSHDRDESYIFSMRDELQPTTHSGWENYLLGVIELVKRKIEIPSEINVVFGGNLPIGSGLSSSAALENAMGFALNELFDLGLSRLDMVMISQKAEHEFAGVHCGIMDQFASMMGEEGKSIFLNCSNLKYSSSAVNLKDCALILINSNVSHNLSDSEYNTRKRECESAIAILQKKNPQVLSLADVDHPMLENSRKELEVRLFSRCEYILEENERVKKLATALESGALEKAGGILYSGHHGMKDKYEISCREIDYLVDLTRETNKVLGARMMGGGFGGCTLNLVKADYIEQFKELILKEYYAEFGFEATSIEIEISDGVRNV